MACFACARDGRILRRGTRWGTDMRKLAAVLFGVAAWLVTGGTPWAAIEAEGVKPGPAGAPVPTGPTQIYNPPTANRPDSPPPPWRRPGSRAGNAPPRTPPPTSDQ